jgi:hypothetical protein
MDIKTFELLTSEQYGRIENIKDEIKTLKEDRNRLNELIKTAEKEIETSEDTIESYTRMYLEDKPYEAIEHFIKKYSYSYKVEDILDSYENQFTKGMYTSYTMNHCIENLINPIKELLKIKMSNIKLNF